MVIGSAGSSSSRTTPYGDRGYVPNTVAIDPATMLIMYQMQVHVPKVRLASVFFVLFTPRPGFIIDFFQGPRVYPSPIMALRRPWPLVCLEDQPIIALSPFKNRTHLYLGL